MFKDTHDDSTGRHPGRGRRGHGNTNRGGGRHRAGGRFGDEFGAGFGAGFGGRGRGYGRGRKLSSEQLQLLLLALMEDGPVHGYDLIQQIDARSGGYYVPSPGVIYPALTYLSEAGHAQAEKDGNRKLYSLTGGGRAFLDANRDDATAILERLGTIAERMDNVRAAFAGDDEIDPATQARFEALRSLKRAVKSRRGCGPEQAEQITAILQRAADEIAALD